MNQTNSIFVYGSLNQGSKMIRYLKIKGIWKKGFIFGKLINRSKIKSIFILLTINYFIIKLLPRDGEKFTLNFLFIKNLSQAFLLPLKYFEL